MPPVKSKNHPFRLLVRAAVAVCVVLAVTRRSDDRRPNGDGNAEQPSSPAGTTPVGRSARTRGALRRLGVVIAFAFLFTTGETTETTVTIEPPPPTEPPPTTIDPPPTTTEPPGTTTGPGDGSDGDDPPSPPPPPVLGHGTAWNPRPPELSSSAAGTIWLHRELPDPTPPARRLSPKFAGDLRAAARYSHVRWELILAVLRARGHNGRAPANPAALRTLATRLAELGARSSSWRAALALSGRPQFADQVVALVRYNRAVGLRALVTGLEAGKPALERRVLRDRRIEIYAGGRADIASGRVDVRVLVLVRYLAVGYGQITVSSLRTGHAFYARPGVPSAHVYGLAVDIAALGGTPIAGHQEPGGLTEQAVKDILLLPAELQPQQVISLLGLSGPSFPLADHDDHIHVGY